MQPELNFANLFDLWKTLCDAELRLPQKWWIFVYIYLPSLFLHRPTVIPPPSHRYSSTVPPLFLLRCSSTLVPPPLFLHCCSSTVAMSLRSRDSQIPAKTRGKDIRVSQTLSVQLFNFPRFPHPSKTFQRNKFHSFHLAAAVWAKPPTIYGCIYIYICVYIYTHI